MRATPKPPAPPPAQRGGKPPSAKRRLLGWLLLCALCGLAIRPQPAQAQRPTEYQVKAAFIYNFPNFVDWPASAFPDTVATLTIGILGKDPFADAFAPFLKRAIRGHQLRIERSSRLQELPFCHILFIGESEQKHLPQILAYLQGRSTLTVGETPGFAEQGVMINFVLRDNKIRFEVNVGASERAGLKLSSRLLKLAILVDGDGEE